MQPRRSLDPALLVAAALLAATGCDTTRRWPNDGPDSVRVTVRAPASLGSPGQRIADREVVVDLEVLDTHGELVADPIVLSTYAQWLGSLTPSRASAAPLQSIEVRGGRAQGVRIPLPAAFGPTVLWFEDTGPDRLSGSLATGASPPIWYPDPTAADVNRPLSEQDPSANERSPLEGKQVKVVAQPGNQLVVTATYSQSYNVSEVTPDNRLVDYGHLYVFSFSKPPVYVGQVLEYVTGGVIEFNGLTELSFPRSAVLEPQPARAFFPAPVKIDAETLRDRIAMEKLEGALVQVENVASCPLESDYDQRNYDAFGQWLLDVGAGCQARFLRLNVVTRGAVPGYDPPPAPGTRLGCITGTLRNVALNDGNTLVWLLYPRPDVRPEDPVQRPSDVKVTGACQ